MNNTTAPSTGPLAGAVDVNVHLSHWPFRRLPLDDAPTYRLLNSGRTIAVFQLESEVMQALCRQFSIATIDEIIALIALYRPGPMQFIPQYIAGKKDPGTIKYAHPLMIPIAKETYGILVYQEQVMEVAKVVGGYTLGLINGAMAMGFFIIIATLMGW